VRAAAAMAALSSIIIGAVVIAPLNESRAHSFLPMTLKPELMAPLNEVGPPENILVIGATPDEDQWFHPGMMERPKINKRLSGGNFKEPTCFYRLWSQEEWLAGISVAILWRDRPDWPLPIHLNGHAPCGSVAAVLPSRLNSKAGNEEAGVVTVTFRQIYELIERPGISSRGQFVIEAVDKHEGAIRDRVLVLAGFPQPVGGALKCPCESSDCERGNSCEQNAISVKERAFTTEKHIFPNDGDTPLRFFIRFFGFLVGGIAAALVYARLIRRR